CPGCVDEAVKDLAMIGLDRVAGYFGEAAVRAWAEREGELDAVEEITVDELDRRLRADEVTVVDVRGRAEWEAGHLPGAPNIPLGYLEDRMEEIPREKPVVLQCRTGSRSAIGASVLKARGLGNVLNLKGGYREWRERGHPVARDGAR
ncbi:MAG: rhodanese-like domain-containing protein, partial [Gemmatimonadota bacterium]